MTNQESTYEKNDIIVKLIHDNIKSFNSFTQSVRYMKKTPLLQLKNPELL